MKREKGECLKNNVTRVFKALIDSNIRNCTDLFPTKQLYREKTGWTLGTQDCFEPVSSGTGVCDILNGLSLFFALHATRGR